MTPAPTTHELAVQVATLTERNAELTQAVAVLQHEAKQAREAQDALASGNAGLLSGQAAANQRERETKDAWRASRGMHPAPTVQLGLEAGEEYQRAVASALAAERDAHEQWREQCRANAARHAAAEHRPDQFQRAATASARQREIEAERKTRLAPVVLDASEPVEGTA